MGGLRLPLLRILLISATACRRGLQAELTIRRRSLREKRLPIVREARIALRARPTHERPTHDRPIRDRVSPIVAKPRRAGIALVPTYHAVRLLRRVRTRIGRRLIVQLLVQARTGLRRDLARQLRRDL